MVSLVLEKYLDEFGKDDRRWSEDDGGDRVMPRSWLRTVAMRTAIDMHRRSEARPTYPVDLHTDGTADWDVRSALRELATPSLMAARGVAAEQALNALRPADQDLLRWALVEDLSLSEIQERTGKSYEATKKAVQHAKARLRNVVAANPDLRETLMDRPEYPLP